ncbi:MAG: hypothetical protein ACYDG4_10720 [Desulfuromonadaceae bacterium]
MSNQKGNVVMIFQDPVTERQEEGPAMLQEFLFASENLECWRVRFLEDGNPKGKKAPLYSRWIRKTKNRDVASRGA